jgi:hypothetical protein
MVYGTPWQRVLDLSVSGRAICVLYRFAQGMKADGRILPLLVLEGGIVAAIYIGQGIGGLVSKGIVCWDG